MTSGFDNITANNLTMSTNPTVFPGLISGSLFWQVLSVVLTLDVLVSMFATGANILTIIVYRTLGYSESINISLTALAISDLGVALTTMTCVLAIVLPVVPNVWFTYEVFINIGAYPHIFFTRASALITTYISVERYICVFLPLRVKRIFTARRTLIIMVVIFVVTFGPFPITLMRYPLGWSFSPVKNTRVLSVLVVTDSTILTSWYVVQLYVSIVLPILTFFTVTLTTVFLASSLQRSRAWRESNRYVLRIRPTTRSNTAVRSSSPERETTADNSKETRAVKLVIAIATVFILATIPSCAIIIVTAVIHGFDLGGRYANMHTITGMFFLGMDSVNSGSNVIIYLLMSTKFRVAARSILNKNQ